MNFSYFLAKRFSFNYTEKRKMRMGVKIASFGVAIGLAIMIIAISVVVGFKQEVSNQVIGFGSHIQVFSYGDSYTADKQPIKVTHKMVEDISSIDGVSNVERVVIKPCVAKTQSNFKGVVFKGVDESYDLSFFYRNLQQGRLPEFETKQNEILISNNIAKTLEINVGDELPAYFFQQKIRSRKFVVSGIYETSFSQFDDIFIICQSDILRRLNSWDSTMVSALEINVKDFSMVEEVNLKIHSKIGNRFDQHQLLYRISTIKEIYPDIFGWLDMLDTNAYIIIILMMSVAIFNIISGLLILILEKTQTIGILKALGMKSRQIREVFLINTLFFVLKGMAWGNLIGIGVVLVEYFFKIIPLNPDFYYTSYVPVVIHWGLIIALNIATIAISLVIMILPSHIITKISPAKSIRFE